MAINPEEYWQRRDQRKKNKSRKTLLRLILAGTVLLACGVLIFFLARPKKEAPPVDPNNVTVIRLAAAGDLNVTESVVASGGDNYDYTATFMDVLPLLGDADITAINFEGNLYDEPYGEDRSAPPSLLTALERTGVDLVQLANSYSIYRGMDGLAKTVQGIRNAGMEPMGAYATQQEAQAYKGYTIRNIQGIKVAFVSFTKGMGGMSLLPVSEGCVNLLYTDYATDYQIVDEEGINKVLSAVADEDPDITIAFVHWGSEYVDAISASQEKISTLMQAGGVDAIIGSHSHFLQRMDYDAESGRFVAWSLGDFTGEASRAGSEYSVVLELEISKHNETGETRISGFSYTPIFTINEEGQPLRVVRIHEAMKAYEMGCMDKVSEKTYNAMKYALERIEARIHGK